MTNCNFDKTKLAGYIDGELPDKEVLDVERHCTACPECAQLLDDLRQNDAVFRAASAECRRYALPAGNYNERLMAKIGNLSKPSAGRSPLSIWKFFVPPLAAAAAVMLFALLEVQNTTMEQPPARTPEITYKGGTSPANNHIIHSKGGYQDVRNKNFQERMFIVTIPPFAPDDEEIDYAMKNSEAILIRFANSSPSDTDNLYSLQAFIQNSGILEQVNGLKNVTDDPSVAEYFKKLEMVYLRISNTDESKNGTEIMSIQEAITSNGLIDEIQSMHRERLYFK